MRPLAVGMIWMKEFHFFIFIFLLQLLHEWPYPPGFDAFGWLAISRSVLMKENLQHRRTFLSNFHLISFVQGDG